MPRRGRRAILELVEVEKPNRRWPIDDRLSIGRSQNSDIQISNPIVSRDHAKIENGYLIDLGSANGTYVNSVRLRARERHLLKPNDKVKLGKKAKGRNLVVVQFTRQLFPEQVVSEGSGEALETLREQEADPGECSSESNNTFGAVEIGISSCNDTRSFIDRHCMSSSSISRRKMKKIKEEPSSNATFYQRTARVNRARTNQKAKPSKETSHGTMVIDLVTPKDKTIFPNLVDEKGSKTELDDVRVKMEQSEESTNVEESKENIGKGRSFENPIVISEGEEGDNSAGFDGDNRIIEREHSHDNTWKAKKIAKRPVQLAVINNLKAQFALMRDAQRNFQSDQDIWKEMEEREIISTKQLLTSLIFLLEKYQIPEQSLYKWLEVILMRSVAGPPTLSHWLLDKMEYLAQLWDVNPNSHLKNLSKSLNEVLKMIFSILEKWLVESSGTKSEGTLSSPVLSSTCSSLITLLCCCKIVLKQGGWFLFKQLFPTNFKITLSSTLNRVSRHLEALLNDEGHQLQIVDSLCVVEALKKELHGKLQVEI